MKRLIKASIITSILASFALAGCNNTSSIPQVDLAPIVNNSAPDQSVNALFRRYKLIDIRGIGEVYEGKLNKIGIKYTDELLKAGAKRKDRKDLAQKSGISEKLILTWVNHIDLTRLNGIGPKQSNWLEAVGVDSIPELANRRADNLHERLEIANNIDPRRKFVRRMVSQKEVQKWIDAAKVTEPYVEVTH